MTIVDPVVARIEVVRTITPDGDLVDVVRAVDGDGGSLALVEALGMLRLAEDSLIRACMGEDDE